MGQGVDKLELGFSLGQCLPTNKGFWEDAFARFGNCRHSI